MYRAPFHRRILPWIFAIVFIAAAPALVFYTAGYRWNPKKDKIERNGTLIIDSVPAGAHVFLNGRSMEDVTPVTLQNVAPGNYLVRVERDGYYPWQKRLDVYPEFVTFANTIRLWRVASPAVFIPQPATAIQSSPNENFIAALVTTSSSTDLIVWTSSGEEQLRASLGSFDATGSSIRWSSNSRGLLVEHPSATGTSGWIANIRSGTPPVALPSGTYEWEGSFVRGRSGRDRISIDFENDRFERTELPPGIHDRLGSLTIRQATGTRSLVLFQEENATRGLVLPPGEWEIVGTVGKQLILRDGNSWLSLDPDEITPVVHRVTGDRLRAYVSRQKTSYLLVDGGELWLWDPANEPELLLRQSQPIIEATWDEDGREVIFATASAISALDLDQRDGRLQTPLTQLDRITGLALFRKTLLLTGERNGASGVWKLEIE
jgi:hypothetical protein